MYMYMISNTALVERVYQVKKILIYPQKHMLRVLITQKHLDEALLTTCSTHNI